MNHYGGSRSRANLYVFLAEATLRRYYELKDLFSISKFEEIVAK
jgi:hypothetical protein